MIVVYLIALLIVVLALVAIVQFNRLRRLDLQAQGAFAGIETLLTKRADLVPNLVATVSGAADFERGTMEAVTAARARVSSASSVSETSAADSELSSALGRLFAVAEAYPPLADRWPHVSQGDRLVLRSMALRYTATYS